MRSVTVRPEGWIETANASNATATASRAADANSTSRHYVTGVSGSFSAAAAGILLVLKEGSTEIGRWYVHNALHVVFDTPVAIAPNTACSAELSAGGSGVTGAVDLTGYTI